MNTFMFGVGKQLSSVSRKLIRGKGTNRVSEIRNQDVPWIVIIYVENIHFAETFTKQFVIGCF